MTPNTHPSRKAEQGWAVPRLHHLNPGSWRWAGLSLIQQICASWLPEHSVNPKKIRRCPNSSPSYRLVDSGGSAVIPESDRQFNLSYGTKLNSSQLGGVSPSLTIQSFQVCFSACLHPLDTDTGRLQCSSEAYSASGVPLTLLESRPPPCLSLHRLCLARPFFSC